jgi:hypothetical protein
MTAPASSFDVHTAPTSWAPAAIVAGALWAVYGVRSGFHPDEYFALLAGGGLSVWLVLIALSQLGSDRRTLETLLPTLALSLLVLSWLGRFLLDSTHHRPLGAATFAFAALLVFALTLLVFARRRVPLVIGALMLLAASAFLVLLLRPFGTALVEPLLGVGLALVTFLLGSRVRARSASLSLACSGSLVSAALICVWLAPSAMAHPFILGLPGLLR